MKKILITFLLTASFSTFADLDFTLSDFCYQQPNVQDRDAKVEPPDSSNHLDIETLRPSYVKPEIIHFYKSGTYYFPNKEVGITKTSICVFKDKYGQYDSKGNLKNGKKEGKWIHWRSNGQKEAEINWKDGKKDGKNIWWYINGEIKSETYYKDGECISGDCD